MKRTKFFALLSALALTLALAAPVQATEIPLAQAPMSGDSIYPFYPSVFLPPYFPSLLATLPTFPITVNGHVLDNDHAQYPIFVYQDMAYLPMTYHFSRFLGLITYWDAETNTYCLRVSSEEGEYVPDTGHAQNGEYLPVEKLTCGVSVNGVKPPIDGSYQTREYPSYLVYHDIVYIPVTAMYNYVSWRIIYWDWSWDEDNGLVIDVERNITQSFREWETTFAGTPLE